MKPILNEHTTVPLKDEISIQNNGYMYLPADLAAKGDWLALWEEAGHLVIQVVKVRRKGYTWHINRRIAGPTKALRVHGLTRGRYPLRKHPTMPDAYIIVGEKKEEIKCGASTNGQTYTETR